MLEARASRGQELHDTQTVASVLNGGTIEAEAGVFGRKTRPVFLAGISAPGLNDPLGARVPRQPGQPGRQDGPRGKHRRPLLNRSLVGQVFGDSGADLAIAQLRAGLATCETQATKDQVARRNRPRRQAVVSGKQAAVRTGGISPSRQPNFPNQLPWYQNPKRRICSKPLATA